MSSALNVPAAGAPECASRCAGPAPSAPSFVSPPSTLSFLTVAAGKREAQDLTGGAQQWN
jgi:hypothetical protein